MQPYFVRKVVDSNEKIIYENTPTMINKTVSKETSEMIKVMFEEVVKNFTGIQSFIPGYRVGGKTGVFPSYYTIKNLGYKISKFFFIYQMKSNKNMLNLQGCCI